ncbi:hypothetical protein FQA39_LY10131 [Lamprigera yunnana]|nr:hypothetical protein FQA39_LY10131 [Lamprigera yunnana]
MCECECVHERGRFCLKLIWSNEIPQETCLGTVGITRQEFNTSFSMIETNLTDIKTKEYLECVWKKHNIIDSEGNVDQAQYNDFFAKFIGLCHNWDSKTTQNNKIILMPVFSKLAKIKQFQLWDPISILNKIKLYLFVLSSTGTKAQVDPFEAFMKVQ